MTERVTTDLDEECYYLDGEYWLDWDHFGEDTAEAINQLLTDEFSDLKIKNDFLQTENMDFRNKYDSAMVELEALRTKLRVVLQDHYETLFEKHHKEIILDIADQFGIELR